MLPLVEFMERLAENRKSNVRNCDNEIEEARHNEVKGIIEPDIETRHNLEPTYWEER